MVSASVIGNPKVTESSHSGWHPCLAAQRATSTSTKPKTWAGLAPTQAAPLLGWAPRENLVARDVSIAELSPSTRPRHLDSSSSSYVCRLRAIDIPYRLLACTRELEESLLWSTTIPGSWLTHGSASNCASSPRGNETPFPLQHSIPLYQDQDSRQVDQ